MTEFHRNEDEQQAVSRDSRRTFLKASTIAMGAAVAGGLSLSRSARAARRPVRASSRESRARASSGERRSAASTQMGSRCDR